MSLGFYFDMTRCSGCAACRTACQDRFDLFEVGFAPPRGHRYQTGTFPSVAGYVTSVSCNHCEKPACVENCPTGAMFKNKDGLVLHDDDVCISCQTCLNVCPYGAPQYIEAENLVVKCDTCNALREGGYLPVCVDACPYRALEFGDLNELRLAHGDDLVQEVSVLPSADVTGPNLLIKSREAALESGYREVTY